MEDKPYILTGWPEIASVNPWKYSEQTIRKKYGPEMKAMGIVVKRSVVYIPDSGLKRCRKNQISGAKYLIEHYFLDKAQKNVH